MLYNYEMLVNIDNYTCIQYVNSLSCHLFYAYVHAQCKLLLLSGNATVSNGMAAVIISELECAVTYTIITGGTLNGTLVGPRSSHGTTTIPACPVKDGGDEGKTCFIQMVTS